MFTGLASVDSRRPTSHQPFALGRNLVGMRRRHILLSITKSSLEPYPYAGTSSVLQSLQNRFCYINNMGKKEAVKSSEGKKKKELFVDSASDDEEEEATKPSVLKINRKYATEFETRKQREELINSRRYGEGSEDDDSSSDESEDEDGELLTPALDVKILQTISKLRNKEDDIYDSSKRFFSPDDEEGKGKVKTNKGKKFKDVIREQILDQMHDEEQGGTSNQIGADDVEENGKRRTGDELTMSKLAYDEEQRELRAAFLSSTTEAQDDGDSNGNENSDNDDDDGGFIPSRKTAKTAQELEEEELMLQKEFEKLEKTKNKATPIKDPRGEVKDSEAFLMDFIKNKQWIDKSIQDASDDEDEDEYPKRGTDEGASIEDGNETDDSMDDKMDAFESKYNFRFEEAAATSGATHSVVGYSRNSAAVTDTLRRKDDSRRQKRLARKERKEAERKAKEEQLRRLKNAKRQEMEEKIKQIKAVLGDGEGGGGNVDDTVMMKLMEGDYDPEKFEEMMANAYGEDFYEKEDAEWKKDEDVRESLKKDTDTVEILDDAEGDLYDNYDNTNDEDVAYAPDGGNYEDDNEDGNEEELQTVKKESEVERKLKAKMLDELYKLDYEDMIGDMPTRFKYRQVEANSYGLSTEEILFAKDTTLKQFVSLKKMAPYGDEGEYFPGAKNRRRFRELVKADIEEVEKEDAAVPEESQEEEQKDEKKKKRRRQKKSKKKESVEADTSISAVSEEADTIEKEAESNHSLTTQDNSTGFDKLEEEHVKKEKRKDRKRDKPAKDKRKKKKSKVEGVSASRLASYGL